jgi:NurA-like 5'-3' nuclease
VVPVGYVDRPGGRALLDLLWVSQLSTEDVLDKCNDNPLQRLTDRALMAKVLAPGERSAWFKRLTVANRKHRGAGQEIWFCYVNFGENRRPMIARLEVPSWAIEEDREIATLHAALQHQVTVLNGYPYVLARAHEQALITTKDKAALDSMIQQRLVAHGVFVQLSEKARQKSYLGYR